ncbi:TPA: hypothetical protein HA219_03975 [Candidatus Woesearchaeota archaeon]|nr:hypothetical protein [Candidatus Woesearchaeota archaeon]HIH39849.1 hypothetical protein [Candidatus Woesearchaeota archaeon]
MKTGTFDIYPKLPGTPYYAVAYSTNPAYKGLLSIVCTFFVRNRQDPLKIAEYEVSKVKKEIGIDDIFSVDELVEVPVFLR